MEVADKHDPNTCYSCIAKRVLEDTQDKKFLHVIVITTDGEGFHSSITGNTELFSDGQKIQMLENLALLLGLDARVIPLNFRSLR